MTRLAVPVDGGTSRPHNPSEVGAEPNETNQHSRDRYQTPLTASDALRIVSVIGAGALLRVREVYRRVRIAVRGYEARIGTDIIIV